MPSAGQAVYRRLYGVPNRRALCGGVEMFACYLYIVWIMHLRKGERQLAFLYIIIYNVEDSICEGSRGDRKAPGVPLGNERAPLKENRHSHISPEWAFRAPTAHTSIMHYAFIIMHLRSTMQLQSTVQYVQKKSVHLADFLRLFLPKVRNMSLQFIFGSRWGVII